MKILQPWRTRGSSTALWQQQHICNSISNGKRKISPNFEMSTGKLPGRKFCRRKLIKVPTVTWAAMCGTTCTVWTKISDGVQLRGFGSLLTKILFSYRSTEVSGTLIVMKVPTERSRSWGRRTGKTANLWKCLKPTASDSLLGSCTRKYSPYGKIKYDTCFEMIDVVPFEMIYDKFRTVVVWPTTTEEKRNDSFRNDRWLSHWYDIWPSFRYQMTVTSKWFMTILSIGQQFL